MSFPIEWLGGRIFFMETKLVWPVSPSWGPLLSHWNRGHCGLHELIVGEMLALHRDRYEFGRVLRVGLVAF